MNDDKMVVRAENSNDDNMNVADSTIGNDSNDDGNHNNNLFYDNHDNNARK